MHNSNTQPSTLPETKTTTKTNLLRLVMLPSSGGMVPLNRFDSELSVSANRRHQERTMTINKQKQMWARHCYQKLHNNK